MNTPVQYRNRPQRSLVEDALSGLGAVRPSSISRGGNRFTLVDSAGNTETKALLNEEGEFYLDVVIVDANKHKSRMYYGDKYREDDPRPPKCWSDNGTGPSAQAIEPQHNVCANCPQSAWNSDINPRTGQGVPACKSYKKIAVVVVGDNTEQVYEMMIPPGSWSGDRGWSRYMETLKLNKIEPWDVITRMSFTVGSIGVLAFKPTGYVEGDLVQQVEAAWESGVTSQICGMTDVARNPSLPLIAKSVAAPAAPQQQMPPPPQPLTGYPNTPPPLQTLIDKHPQTAKRRGRPPKDPMAVPQPKPPVSGNGGEALDLPPFLQRPPAVLAAPQPATNVVTGQSSRDVNFGLQTPSTPPQDVQDALAAAFNLKTG